MNSGQGTVELIKNISWLEIKKTLITLGRTDIVDWIKDNTLITQGRYTHIHIRQIRRLIKCNVFFFSESNVRR